MSSRLIFAGRWLRRRAENVAALMLVAMFVCFLLQIVFRYVLNFPLGWTHEISTLLWVWGILWGAAFVARERDEVRFDIIYTAMSRRTRAVFTVITGVALVAIFVAAMRATISYVSFMRVERSAYLGVRMDVLYSIYVVFAVAIVVRYVWLTWQALRGHPPETDLGSGSAL
jgi:TRAP-type C4-dicarboxylate transport system permease small subunit